MYSIYTRIVPFSNIDLITPSDIEILEYQWANLVDFDISVEGYANE